MNNMDLLFFSVNNGIIYNMEIYGSLSHVGRIKKNYK